jgi:heptosyltransferase-2
MRCAAPSTRASSCRTPSARFRPVAAASPSAGLRDEGRRSCSRGRRAYPSGVRGRSQVYYYRALLAGAGLAMSAAPDVSLRCPPDWTESARADRLLGPDGDEDWVGVNPGAFYGTAKRWLPERFRRRRGHPGQRGARIVARGRSGRSGRREPIAAQMRAPARVLCGETSLAELVGRPRAARSSSPTTPAHAPRRRPRRAGGGRVRPHRTGARPIPWGRPHPSCASPVHCSPCGLRECPIDHRCMRRVTVDRVLAETGRAGERTSGWDVRPSSSIGRHAVVRDRIREPSLPLPPPAVCRRRRAARERERPPGRPVTNQAGSPRLFPGEPDPRGPRPRARGHGRGRGPPRRHLRLRAPPFGRGAPYRQDCDCRKPRPGLLRQARKELGADLARSWMIGDRHGDLAVAWAAGRARPW